MIAWFQCSAGASGDMLLGALIDAGAPLEEVQRAVDAVGTEQILVSASQVLRHELAATKVEVKVARSVVVRTWANVRALLEDADLPAAVRDRALDVFARLARAEAQAHRTTPDQVHFHEVGALDAIADVVGVSAALAALDIDEVHSSAVAVGQGMVRSEHGLLPVPAPAVVALLSEVEAPVYSGDLTYELCTPTGAALLASTVSRWGGLPSMRVSATGLGAGSRDLTELPNVVRVIVGTPAPLESQVTPTAGLASLLEANVDDLDPRLWPAVLSQLLSAGAADAWLTPIVMKKGRPAHTLAVLVPPELAEEVRRVMFTETSTIGLRESLVAKRALLRETRTVEVEGCEIQVKVALLAGEVVNAQPEYDDVAAAAAKLGRPVKAVLAAATAAAHAAGYLP